MQLEVRDGDFPRNSFIDENGFCYPVFFFVIPNLFENYFSYVYEEVSWDFDGDCIESIDCFRQDGHFYSINPANPRAREIS